MRITIESAEELDQLKAAKDITLVTELNISQLALTYIPEWIFELPYLRKLNASRNQIAAIPDGIAKLGATIRELYLNDNLLKQMPSAIGKFSRIQILYLDNNDLQALPGDIGNCILLNMLSLNDNANLKAVPQTLSNLNQLQELNLCRCNLSTLPFEMKANISMQALRLVKNNISTLPPCIPYMTNLYMLSLTENPIPEGEKTVIRNTLKYINQLTV